MTVRSRRTSASGTWSERYEMPRMRSSLPADQVRATVAHTR